MDSITKMVIDEMVASHGWILWGALVAVMTFSALIIGACWYQIRKTEQKLLEVIYERLRALD